VNSLYANMDRWSPHVLSLLRIIAALLFLEHGLSKVFGFPTPGPSLHQGCSTLSTEGHGEYCFEACESGGEAVLRN